MSDHEIDYLHRKLAPLSTTSSFCQDAQKLSVLMNNVDISSSALSTDPLVADWLEENSEVPISCPNHKTPNSARNSTEQSDAKIIKCPPSRPIQSSNFIYDSCDEKDEVRLDPEMNQSHRLFVEAKAESQTEKYKADINVEYFGDSLSSNISETRNLNTKTVAKSGSKLSEATILSHERNEITRQQPSLTNSSPKIGVQIDDSISINEQGPHIGYANVSVGRIGVIPQARQLPKESLSRTWLFSAKTDVHFDPANLEHCVSKFCSSINARYCIVGGKTTGSNGKQHYQGYVYRGDKIRFSALCISLKEAFGFLFQVTRVKEDHEKNRQCCSSDREFFEYGYLPKLAVAAELVNAEPTPQKEAQKSSVDDSKQHAPSMLLSDIQDLKQIKIDFHSPPFSTDKYRYDVLKEEKVYKADRMKIDFNYGTCEACHKPGKLICCDSCCCSYHLKCCVPKLSEIPPGDWHCRPCVDTGADQINVVAEEEKNEGLCGKWLLFWNSSAHRWFPGFVLEYSQSLGAFLCEYWINLKQGRQKKQRWLDIARARILYATSGESLLDNLDMKNGREKTLRISDEHITSRQSATLDTHIGADSVKAAYCAAAIACRAVDIVMQNSNANAFCCIRPPGHHAGRYGFTQGCMSTGFCLLNNAAIAMVYSRVKWDLERVAVVDIDVHHGNGTAELLKEDPRAFFACTHMIYGTENCGFRNEAKGAPRYSDGFYPSELGTTEISDNFVSIGIFPKLFETKANYSESDINLLAGPHGFRFALENIILPRLKKFDPELIIISGSP